MQLTVDISDDLAVRISDLSNALPRVLMLGLRELHAEDLGGFNGFSDVLEFLASLPTPQEILALRPSPALQEEMEQLLEKSRDTGLNAEEEERWRRLEYLEHLVRKAKIHAARRLNLP
jgi:hypothetical protein